MIGTTDIATRLRVARPWLEAREKWVAILDCASPNSTVGKIARENIAWIDLSLRRLDGRA
jgi:hypothetical protein